jgi:hypothetical protein
MAVKRLTFAISGFDGYESQLHMDTWIHANSAGISLYVYTRIYCTRESAQNVFNRYMMSGVQQDVAWIDHKLSQSGGGSW